MLVVKYGMNWLGLKAAYSSFETLSEAKAFASEVISSDTIGVFEADECPDDEEE